MFFTNSCKNKSVYNRKRYWYHVSTTLNNKIEHLIPWDEFNSVNRGDDEPDGKRICVSPSIEQCISAVPYYFATVFKIYRTLEKIKVNPAVKVYDAHITMEGWIETPMDFIKIGYLDFGDIENGLNIENVIHPCAAENDLSYTKKVLKWWKNADLKQFVKTT